VHECFGGFSVLDARSRGRARSPPSLRRHRTKHFAPRIVAGTSVGANYREAYRGRSKAKFIAKCGDSLRELEETAYWLELLVDGKIVPSEWLSALRQECDELIAIFVTILKRSKIIS
jgi:four helix bundle protein